MIEGFALAQEKKLSATICPKYVLAVVEILEEMLRALNLNKKPLA